MKKYIAIALALLLMLGMAACGDGSDPAPTDSSNTDAGSSGSSSASDEGPIIIGFLGWSSGPDSLYGLVPQYLLTDYFKQVNANGGWLGREIDFRPYDVSGLGGDFSEAVNATNKLIQAGAHAIIGPSNSTQSTAVAEICNREGVLHIPSGSSQVVTVDENGDVRPYTYRAGPENRDYIDTLAAYAYYELNNPKIAILYETTQIDCVNMRDQFQETFEAAGGTILGDATYQIDDLEFRAQIRSLAELGPDYIFMPAMAYKEIGNVAKQLSELGYADSIKILTQSTADTADLLTLAGSELEGMLFITTGDMDAERFDDIRASYEENHGDSGMSLHIDGLISFNEAKILEYAILTAGSTDTEAMRKALDETEGFDMITGPNKGYDPETHNLLGLEFTIKTIENGAFKSLGFYARPLD